MSETYDWASRVDQMTAATASEQLRTVVRDAEAMLEKFTASASEQGGLLLDAQRDMEAAVERKIAEVSSGLTDSLEGMRKEIASIDRTPSVAAVDLEPLRKDVFTGLAAFGEELDAETKKMREEIAARMEEIGARLSAMDATQRKLEARVEDALRSTDERLAMIQTLLERAAGMEERAAARMVDLLATAFADLRTAPPSAPPTLVAS